MDAFREVIRLHMGVGIRIEDLILEGFTGPEIAKALRDEGFPITDVQVALSEYGYAVRTQMFLELKALEVSDFPLQEGDELYLFSGGRNSDVLAIWLQNGHPSRKAYMN